MKIKYYSLWLVLVCIFVFLLQAVIPGFTDLFLLNQQAYPQLWRFVTSIFLHASMGHLFYNMLALGLLGFILEKLVGSRKFLLIFFASGIFANLIAVNFYSASLGASGAIYGIIGALTIIRPFMMVFAFGVPLPMFGVAILYVVVNLVQTFVPSDIGTIAHLSGIVIGFLFGLFLRKKSPKKQKIVISEAYITDWEKKHLGLGD